MKKEVKMNYDNHDKWMMAMVPFDHTAGKERDLMGKPLDYTTLENNFNRYPTDIRNFKELKIYKDMLKKDKVILEIGCHVGAVLRVMLEEGECIIHAIEPSKTAFDFASKKMEELGYLNKRVFLKNNFLDEVDYNDKTFDYIISYYMYEHQENPLDMTDKAKKWLKKDGKLVIGCPNVEGFFNGELSKWRHAVKTHLWLPGLKTLSNILVLEGFTIEKILTFGGFIPVDNVFKKIFNKFLKLINKGDGMVIISSYNGVVK